MVVWAKNDITSVFADDIKNDFTIGTSIIDKDPHYFILKAISIASKMPMENYDESIPSGISYKIKYDTDNGGRELTGNNIFTKDFTALMDLVKEFDPKEIGYRIDKQKLKDTIAKYIDKWEEEGRL